jgi:hypothetical protein
MAERRRYTSEGNAELVRSIVREGRATLAGLDERIPPR